MPHHGAKQVLDIIRVQAGPVRLGAAGGDEVLLAGRVEGGQIVLVFDLGHLLDDALPLGQQLDQLLVETINLLAQRFEAGGVCIAHCPQSSPRRRERKALCGRPWERGRSWSLFPVCSPGFSLSGRAGVNQTG